MWAAATIRSRFAASESKPSEVETAFRAIEGIRDAVVVGRPGASGETRLIAYVVADAGTAVAVTRLREILARGLPAYMIPSVFVAMDALPQTPSGKTDRRRLPAVDGSRPEIASPFTPPRTELERALVRIWSEALGVTWLGVDDNFLDAGGDSLIALRIVAQIKATLGVEFSLTDTLRFSDGRRGGRRDLPVLLRTHDMNNATASRGTGSDHRSRAASREAEGPARARARLLLHGHGVGHVPVERRRRRDLRLLADLGAGAGAPVSLRLGEHRGCLCPRDRRKPASRLRAHRPLAGLDVAGRDDSGAPRQQPLHGAAHGQCRASADVRCRRPRAGPSGRWRSRFSASS